MKLQELMDYTPKDPTILYNTDEIFSQIITLSSKKRDDEGNPVLDQNGNESTEDIKYEIDFFRKKSISVPEFFYYFIANNRAYQEFKAKYNAPETFSWASISFEMFNELGEKVHHQTHKGNLYQIVGAIRHLIEKPLLEKKYDIFWFAGDSTDEDRIRLYDFLSAFITKKTGMPCENFYLGENSYAPGFKVYFHVNTSTIIPRSTDVEK